MEPAFATVAGTLQAELALDSAGSGTLVRLIFRLVAAALFGGLLGWDRERAGKAAGLRTHMLVCVGTAIFLLGAQETGMATSDLSHVMQGVAAGVGFLGGGVILKPIMKARSTASPPPPPSG